MAQVTTVQNSWVGGMKRDFPRDQMPPQTAWNAVDLILNYGAPLRQRGGWAHWSQDLTGLSAGFDQVKGGVSATFSTSAGAAVTKSLAIAVDTGVNAYLVDATTQDTATLIGALGYGVAQNPVFHGGTAASAATTVYTGLVIIPPNTPSAAIKKYDGTTLSLLGGTPPQATRASVYKDFTVLGNGIVGTTNYPNRVWFSPEGDPDVAASGAVTAWDTTDSWIDFSQPIKGFGATKNALLVFGDSQLSRIRGSTPPPDEDMVVDDPLFQVGLLDALSIVEHKESVFWCAPEGVFRSDGVVLDDLSKKGGMLRYWLDLVSAATSTWTFAAGTIRDQLFISVMDGSTFKDCFQIDLQSYAWTRHSNMNATSFWTGLQGQADELYWGRKDAARVCTLDSFFSKVGNATYKADGNGTAVLPTLETSFYEFRQPGQKRIKSCYVGYELTDYGTDNPSFEVRYITTPEETAYTTPATNTLAESTTYIRKRVPFGFQAPGVAIWLRRGSGAGDTLIYDLGYDVHALESSRMAA